MRVRQPLYREGRDQWRRYQRWLTPPARRPRRCADELPPREAVAERPADHPRPQRSACDDELIGTLEHAGGRVAQVLAVEVEVPRILRNTGGCLVHRIRRVLEPSPRGREGPAGRDQRIRTGLRERMASVGSTELDEGEVSVHVPIVAGASAPTDRRCVGGRRALGTEWIHDVVAAAERVASESDRLADVGTRGY